MLMLAGLAISRRVARRASSRITPPLTRLSHRSRGQKVRRVCDALQSTYRQPRHGNPESPLDDLLFIIVSNKTAPTVARAAYRRLRDAFPQWNLVLSSRRQRLERLLRSGGLSNLKSRQIYAALRMIVREFGACSLDALRELSTPEAHSYLTSLPGVSDKVAKCVLMYTCGAQVLPVDTHVHRIARRLGWTRRERADQCHEELEAIVPAQRRYGFHVNCVAHGRSCCRPARPDCDTCCIKRHCHYGQRAW